MLNEPARPATGARIPVKLHRRVCLVQTEDAVLAEELLARKKLAQDIVGRLTDRGYAAYGTAKGALSHLTRLMASDLAPRIRVNGIAVGSVATSALEIVLTNDDLRNEMVANTPLRRLGETDDIAIAALYLASPASSFVTGKVLEVDGGIEYPNLALNLPDL